MKDVIAFIVAIPLTLELFGALYDDHCIIWLSLRNQ